MVVLLSTLPLLICSFYIGGISIRRASPLLARINKSPGLEVSVDELRGTTVPTPLVSKKISQSTDQTHARLFNLEAVDPADPFTFGYVHVGKVIGAHGVHGEVKIQINPDFVDFKVKAGSQLYIKKPTRRTPRPVSVARSRRQGSSDSEIHLVLFDHVHTRTVASLFSKYEVYVKETNARANLGTDEYIVRDMIDLDCYSIRDFEAVMRQLNGGGPAVEDSSAGTHSPTEKISPIARIVGIVTADELCDGPAAASLMHDQLELEVFPVAKPLNRAARRKMKQLIAEAATGEGAPVPQQTHGYKVMRCCLMPLVPSIVPVVDLQRRVVFLDPPPGLLDLTYEVKEKEKPIRGFLPAFIERLTPRDRELLAARMVVSS